MKTYLRHRIWNVLEVKELIALEYLDFEGKYKDYTEHHNFWELCFVECGELSLCINGECFTLKEKEILLVAPDKIHSYISSGGNSTKAFVVCFESSSPVLKILGGVRFSADETLRQCMENVIEESTHTFKMNEEEHLEVLAEPNFGGQQAIMIQIEYLLIRLIRELSAQTNAAVIFLNGEHFYSDLSKVVLRFFEENLTENLSLDDVCKKMNYSRSFLCKTFKKQTNETLMGCFGRMRAQKAAQLLEETDWQVTWVATHLGFSEEKHFGVLFKRYMGVSPSEYRKRQREKEQGERE